MEPTNILISAHMETYMPVSTYMTSMPIPMPVPVPVPVPVIRIPPKLVRQTGCKDLKNPLKFNEIIDNKLTIGKD